MLRLLVVSLAIIHSRHLIGYNDWHFGTLNKTQSVGIHLYSVSVKFICIKTVHTEVKIGLYICYHSGYMSMHKFAYILYVGIMQNNNRASYYSLWWLVC